LRRRGHLVVDWACGRTRQIEPGSRAFFMRLGVAPKGLFAAGVTISEPISGPHWRADKPGAQALYLGIRIEALSAAPVILLDELTVPPFSRFRWTVRQSGTRVPSSLADALEPLWEKRLAAAEAASVKTVQSRAVASRSAARRPTKRT
jgi:hypothetical protein